jgi:hypothetical protein
MPEFKVAIVVNDRSDYQRDHAQAMARGLRQNGDEPVMTRTGLARCDAAVCWGWRAGSRLRKTGKNVLIFERGYLGNRGHWTSMAWNGLNGRGDFCLPSAVDPQRFETHFAATMKPWKEGGDYVLIMGQKPGDMSLSGRDLVPWYRETASLLRKMHGLPVLLRPHPVAVQQNKWVSPPGVDISEGSLEGALAGAALCVTWNSNSATEAVMAGVPAITFDIGAPAYPVTGHDLEEIARPDRLPWARRLAWCQWTLDEIAGGEPWARLRTLLERHEPSKLTPIQPRPRSLRLRRTG